MDTLGIIGLGIVVFISTNIDDIFVLMMFFSDQRYKSSQVILGQYVGIGLLVAISVIGALAALVVPPALIGLMGVLPIAIGLKKLFDLSQSRKTEAEEIPQQTTRTFQFLAVAAVTFSNGGDNIGVYAPLFANSPLIETALMVGLFMLMVAVWCALAFYLARRSVMKHYIQRIGHVVLPFVLIGLGMYILAEAFL